MSEVEFNSAVIGFRSELILFAVSLTGGVDDALDLVQDTYVKIFIFKDSLMNYEKLKGGVIRILKNTFINDYRLAQRHPLIDRTKDLVSDTTEYPSADCFYSVKELNGMVAKLSNANRTPFQLHIKGYTHEEIAVRLKLPVGTVKSNVCRARKRLTKVLINNGYR